jgi:hypothetical protein
MNGLSRNAFTLFWFLDHLLGTRKFEPLRGMRERLHSRLTRSGGKPNRFKPVPEVKTDYLDAGTLRRLVRGGPVLFKGLVRRAPAMIEWTFPALMERYGEQQQPAHRSGAQYYEKSLLPLEEILRRIVAGQPTHMLRGGGKWDPFNTDPRMQRELALADWADEAFLKKSAYRGSLMFISGAGHWTPIHTEMGHILSAQVRGSRRWTLYEPACSPYLLPEISRSLVIHSDLYANAGRLRDEAFGLNGWECVTEEGDVLFCPLYHWHFVETIRPSISVSSKWVSLGSLARHPVISAMFATSRQPTLLGYLKDMGKGEQYKATDPLVPRHLR